MKIVERVQLNAYAYLRYKLNYNNEHAVAEAKKSTALGSAAIVFVICICLAIVSAGLGEPPSRPNLLVEVMIKLILLVCLLVLSRFLYKYALNHDIDTSIITPSNANKYVLMHHITYIFAGLCTVFLIIGAGLLNSFVSSMAI